MAARGDFCFTNINGVEMSLTITMKVAEWRNLKTALQGKSFDGSWYLNDLLNQLLDKADKELWAFANEPLEAKP